MRYSTSQDLENTSKDTAFCCLQENLVINMVKKIMDTATKKGIDAAKTASKGVIKKTVEATEDLIGNKIAAKITSIGKPKEKEKKKKAEEIYIQIEKRQQIIDDLNFF